MSYFHQKTINVKSDMKYSFIAYRKTVNATRTDKLQDAPELENSSHSWYTPYKRCLSSL